MSTSTMFFAVLAAQIIILGILWMLEPKMPQYQPDKPFWRRRWRLVAVMAVTAIHAINIAFMHGSGLLYIN